jgi:hypothetical protein
VIRVPKKSCKKGGPQKVSGIMTTENNYITSVFQDYESTCTVKGYYNPITLLRIHMEIKCE